MAQLQQTFDARNVDPSQALPALPVGKHPMIFEASEIKENKDKTGAYVEFTAVIIDGPAKGQKGPYRLNLYHTNHQTVEIAYRQLSALCHVTGVYQINDTNQLHNKPFIGEVNLQKSEEAKAKGYTQLERVYDMQGNEPGKQGQTPPPAQTQAPPQQTPPNAGWTGNPPAQQQPPSAAWTPPQGNTPPSNAGWPGQQQPPGQNPQAGNGGGAPGAPWQR